MKYPSRNTNSSYKSVNCVSHVYIANAGNFMQVMQSIWELSRVDITYSTCLLCRLLSMVVMSHNAYIHYYRRFSFTVVDSETFSMFAERLNSVLKGTEVETVILLQYTLVIKLLDR